MITSEGHRERDFIAISHLGTKHFCFLQENISTYVIYVCDIDETLRFSKSK